MTSPTLPSSAPSEQEHSSSPIELRAGADAPSDTQAASTPRVEAVKAALAYHIANDIERSIAALGYAVGMGIAPAPDVCQQAAERIVDKIKDAALALLAERATGQ